MLFWIDYIRQVKMRYGGRHFWARGYFCVMVGQMTEKMIKEYLEHHFEPSGDDGFEVDPDFQSITLTHRLLAGGC